MKCGMTDSPDQASSPKKQQLTSHKISHFICIDLSKGIENAPWLTSGAIRVEVDVSQGA